MPDNMMKNNMSMILTTIPRIGGIRKNLLVLEEEMSHFPLRPTRLEKLT